MVRFAPPTRCPAAVASSYKTLTYAASSSNKVAGPALAAASATTAVASTPRQGLVPASFPFFPPRLRFDHQSRADATVHAQCKVAALVRANFQTFAHDRAPSRH